MQFGLINPRAQTMRLLMAATLEQALTSVGLDPGKVNHAVVRDGLAIIVGGHSLMVPPRMQNYFALAAPPHRPKLYAGMALLYEFDLEGDTIDFKDRTTHAPLRITWMNGPADVEDAIEKDFIERPAITVNGVVTWEWRANPMPREKMH